MFTGSDTRRFCFSPCQRSCSFPLSKRCHTSDSFFAHRGTGFLGKKTRWQGWCSCKRCTGCYRDSRGCAEVTDVWWRHTIEMTHSICHCRQRELPLMWLIQWCHAAWCQLSLIATINQTWTATILTTTACMCYPVDHLRKKLPLLALYFIIPFLSKIDVICNCCCYWATVSVRPWIRAESVYRWTRNGLWLMPMK